MYIKCNCTLYLLVLLTPCIVCWKKEVAEMKVFPHITSAGIFGWFVACKYLQANIQCVNTCVESAVLITVCVVCWKFVAEIKQTPPWRKARDATNSYSSLVCRGSGGQARKTPMTMTGWISLPGQEGRFAKGCPQNFSLVLPSPRVSTFRPARLTKEKKY
jgi:hypothetical protein